MTCILLCDHRSYQHIVTPTFRFWSWCSAFLEGSDTRTRSRNFGLIFSSSHFPSVEMKNVGIPILWRNQLSDFGPVVRFSGIIRVGWPFPSERKWKTGNSSEIWWKHPTKRRWSFERQSDRKFLEKGLKKGIIYEGRKWWADKPSCVEEKQIKNGGVCETPSWIVKVKLLGSHTENLLNCVN